MASWYGKFRQARLGAVALVALSPALVACSLSDSETVTVAVIGGLPGSKGAAPGGYPAQLVRGATAEGLVAFDELGRVVPALADRWIVTDDGRSYIFRLRDGKWDDGTEITGENARAALQQALAAQRGTAFGLDLAVVEEVKTMAGRVIELRLARPEPDMLQLLAQPELGLLKGSRGAGPMRASDQQGWLALKPLPPEDRGMVPEEGWKDRARTIELHGYSAENAIARFDEGQMAIVLGGRIEDFPRIDIAGLSRGAIRFDQPLGLFGLAVVKAEGFLAAPENREAIAMAIDREALVGAFGLGGWTATTRIVSPGVADDTGTIDERWTGQDLAQRRATAAARVEAWKARNPDAAPLRIALPPGPGGDVLLRQLSADLGAIGLKTVKVAPGATADMRFVDSVARYPRLAWFLNQLSCAARQALCSPTADSLAARARTETDPAVRAELLSDAEAELTKTNGFIPFGTPIRWSLVSGSITGFTVNRWTVHPLMPLAMIPK
jgi:peptide/nickel transport system substrate-binding protein/oligopeptide transport system substrate-binding protein